MSLVQSLITPSLPLPVPNHHHKMIKFSLSWVRDINKKVIRNTKISCSNSTEAESTAGKEDQEEVEELILALRAWDVPWDWKVTACVMMPYILSPIFARILGSEGLEGLFQPDHQLHSPDDAAIHLLLDQLLKFVVKLSILYVFVSPHRPFSDDIFSLRFDQPFNLSNGWLLWASGGFVIGSSAVVTVLLLKVFIFASAGSQAPNQADFLVRSLPLIGSSNVSTLCLLLMSGVLAPICEETLYRGFFMTSLTKWFPVPLSVILSSASFAFAHPPEKAAEIFTFGTILGLVYARTRNLLAPIVMHAVWNSGVILILTFLHSQGDNLTFVR